MGHVDLDRIAAEAAAMVESYVCGGLCTWSRGNAVVRPRTSPPMTRMRATGRNAEPDLRLGPAAVMMSVVIHRYRASVRELERAWAVADADLGAWLRRPSFHGNQGPGRARGIDPLRDPTCGPSCRRHDGLHLDGRAGCVRSSYLRPPHCALNDRFESPYAYPSIAYSGFSSGLETAPSVTKSGAKCSTVGCA